ncbi:major capsid protein [Corynebacterium pygosceleis]|uniref:major capsid protein n=1 Tax=Corynebacterium pygosceleis TaxID=2800406 RepID=UPI002005EC12|nr:major capsid protein [Corynebacterium pygosceleis]MCK7676353.1 major capsid protein [Corynebacterium pygosceleis]
MALWTDLIEPAELTTYARRSLEEKDRAEGRLSAFLPSQFVNDITVRYEKTNTGLRPVAEYRAYDAESTIGSREGGKRVTLDLPPISQKDKIGEFETLKNRGVSGFSPNAKITAARVMDGIVDAILDRVELQRGQIIESGHITIEENGMYVDADLNRDASMTVDAKVKWDKPKSTAVEDLLTWAEAYSEKNGEMPGTILMSRKMLSALQRSEQVKAMLTTVTTPGIVSIDALNGLLGAYDLPAVATYNRKVNHGGEIRSVLDPNKVFLLPEMGTNKLGSTTWGQPAEADNPRYFPAASPERERGGIIGSLHEEDDPYGYWVRATSIVLPVMTHPDAAMVATALA